MLFSIGADHRGFSAKTELIKWLNSQHIEFNDFGATSEQPDDDYNDYAKLVAEAVLISPAPDHFGVLICGSGQGMAMQANRYPGVRAAVCYSPSVAAKTRGHNSANIICIPADDHPDVPAIVQAFISATPLTDEKHQRRNQKLDEI